MNKRIIITIAVFYLITDHFFAQDVKKLEKQLEHKEVIIKSKDSIIRCNVFVEKKEIKTKTECQYFWCDNNKIFINTGSYSGKLLDGEYEVKSTAGNLMTKGVFKNGMKEGRWISWYPNGKVKSTCRLKKGNFTGKMKHYNKSGVLRAVSRYKKNMLNGLQVQYNDKNIMKSKYRNGVKLWEKTIFKTSSNKRFLNVL